MKYTKEYKQRMRVAKKIIRSTKNTSTSYLQRKMEIGYNYADVLMGDTSKERGFRFVYRARRKLLGKSFRKKRRFYSSTRVSNTHIPTKAETLLVYHV